MIREKLKKEEYIDKDVNPFEKIFLGECVGIVLKKRSENDLHVCFQIIIEDDEGWFISEHKISSNWLNDYLEVLIYTKKWCDMNCDKNDEGWAFKSH